jgi:hypothetical protein
MTVFSAIAGTRAKTARKVITRAMANPIRCFIMGNLLIKNFRFADTKQIKKT